MKRYLLSAAAALVLGACSGGSGEGPADETETAAAGSDMATIAAVDPIPGDDALRQAIVADWDAHLRGLYEHFHANPELSRMEVQTAARLAQELRDLGFTVTEQVGETGVVAVMENGEGPTLMMRADMDGLPILEETGLPYASTARGMNQFGIEQPIMHACAHDTHMTALVGAARQLVNMTDDWSGTLVLIGQPAEEVGLGAIAMLQDGLYERFPLPDFNVSFHTFAATPTGQITYHPGYAMANVDTVDIFVQGAVVTVPIRTLQRPDLSRLADRDCAAGTDVARNQPARAGRRDGRCLQCRVQAQHHRSRGSSSADGPVLF